MSISVTDVKCRSINLLHNRKKVIKNDAAIERTVSVKNSTGKVPKKRATAYQYGVPINESLFCRLFAFLAETPKSAKMKENIITISQ